MRKQRSHARPGSPGRLVFYCFSNEAGQYVNEQCLVQPLYSSQGGPPTWSQWWSKYCCADTSPSLARRVNCGPMAELCYLSLSPANRCLRHWGQSRRALSLSPSLPSPSWSGNQLIVVDVSGLGWLAESHVFQEDDKRPSGAGGKGRPGGNEVPADARVTGRRFRFFFPLINIG